MSDLSEYLVTLNEYRSILILVALSLSTYLSILFVCSPGLRTIVNVGLSIAEAMFPISASSNVKLSRSS